MRLPLPARALASASSRRPTGLWTALHRLWAHLWAESAPEAHLARARGIPVVEINPAPTELSDAVDEVWRETAARALPALVAAVLA